MWGQDRNILPDNKNLKENTIKNVVPDFIPNANEMLAKNIRSYQAIMASGEKNGKNSKTKILERIIEAKKLLKDRGFNATYIEIEDVHLNRRYKEAIDEKM